MIQYTAQLDFTDNGVFETGWRLKQGDFGDCAIIFKVVNNGEDMYDSQITPTIAFKRTDGKSIVSQMQDNNGTYKYVFVGNELAVPGSVVCDVKYEDASGRTSTASCRFTVLEDTIGYDPTGAATYNNPVSVIAEGAKVNSLTSEGYALGTQNGEPVGEESPYYHNNSKYYCERAEGYTPEWYQDLMDDIDYYEEQGYITKNLFKVSIGTAPSSITFTKNSDDSITINNDGTNSSEAVLLLGSYLLKGSQTIKFVGCPSSGGDNSYRLDLRESSSSVLVSDSGSGNTYTNPTAVDKTVYLYARFAANYSANSLSFKPMISTDTDITYSDYMPYAPSNRDITKYTLTGTIIGETQKIYLNGDDGSSQYVSIVAPNDRNKADVDTLAYVENNDPSTLDPASRDYVKGEHFILWGDFCVAITDIEEGAFLQENVNYKKDNVGDALQLKTDISAIGTDESGRTTASRQYATGERFYKDGKYCRTKTAVAQGATWTLNTNYEEISIADDTRIEESTATVPSAMSQYISIERQTIVRQGNVVSVAMQITVNNMPSGGVILNMPFANQGTAKFFGIYGGSSFSPTGTGVYISSDSSEVRCASAIPNGNHWISGTYIRKTY